MSISQCKTSDKQKQNFEKFYNNKITQLLNIFFSDEKFVQTARFLSLVLKIYHYERLQIFLSVELASLFKNKFNTDPIKISSFDFIF